MTTKDANWICHKVIDQPKPTCVIRQCVKRHLEFDIARQAQGFRKKLETAIQESVIAFLQINAF